MVPFSSSRHIPCNHCLSLFLLQTIVVIVTYTMTYTCSSDSCRRSLIVLLFSPDLAPSCYDHCSRSSVQGPCCLTHTHTHSFFSPWLPWAWDLHSLSQVVAVSCSKPTPPQELAPSFLGADMHLSRLDLPEAGPYMNLVAHSNAGGSAVGAQAGIWEKGLHPDMLATKPKINSTMCFCCYSFEEK